MARSGSQTNVLGVIVPVKLIAKAQDACIDASSLSDNPLISR